MANIFKKGFTKQMEQYASKAEWEIAVQGDSSVSITFDMNSGSQQTCFIINYPGAVEFSCPSFAAFESEEQIPGILSTMMLQANAKRTMGFWCIEEIDNKYIFSIMHNIPLHQLTQENFEEITTQVVNECERVEIILHKILNDGNIQ